MQAPPTTKRLYDSLRFKACCARHNVLLAHIVKANSLAVRQPAVDNFVFTSATRSSAGDREVSNHAITHEQSLITKILTIHFQANIDFSLCCNFQRLVFCERREILPTDRQTDRYIHKPTTVCPVAPPTEA